MPKVVSALLLIFAAAFWVPLGAQTPGASQPPGGTAQTSPAVPAVPQGGPGNTAPLAPSLSVVVLDPAHGGADSGARGPSGTIESDLVLNFSRTIRAALEMQGFRVVLTRDANQDPSFDDRSTLINGIRDAVFISLHISSTGPVGTARAYSYAFPNSAPGDPADSTIRAQQFGSAAAPKRAALVEWDRAQMSYLTRSQRLAELVQIQLAQKFQGSPDTPLQVPVRQLRTIAAPAVAIEISSVAATDPKKLAQMGQPLADAVARAVVDFRASVRGGAAAENPR